MPCTPAPCSRLAEGWVRGGTTQVVLETTSFPHLGLEAMGLLPEGSRQEVRSQLLSSCGFPVSDAGGGPVVLGVRGLAGVGRGGGQCKAEARKPPTGWCCERSYLLGICTPRSDGET